LLFYISRLFRKYSRSPQRFDCSGSRHEPGAVLKGAAWIGWDKSNSLYKSWGVLGF
jgi:hypothetical protein